MAAQPNVLVVAPSLGVKSTADLIKLAKDKPGQLNFASAGIGSGTHLNAEGFKFAAGVDIVHVPYKGTPEALTDTMTGRVTFFFSPISAALPHVREGKLVALAVSTGKRSSALKDVPTVAESGLPGYDYSLWVGMFAPAGTPADVTRQDRRRRRARDAVGRRARAARGAGCGGDADDDGRIPQVRARRDRDRGEGHQGRRHQAAVSPGFPSRRRQP